MVFSSLFFITIFLPIVLILYFGARYISKNQNVTVKNIILLVISLIFYALSGIKYIFLMLSVIVINWLGGLAVSKSRKKLILSLFVITDLAILFFFKYFNFSVSILEKIVFRGNGGSFLFEKIVLPVGISFYIFQALSYVIDVYREKVNPQKNFFSFALYISFFPQLIAGPIVQYNTIEEQLSNRNESISLFASGIRRFCYGLGKKVIIANALGGVVDSIWSLDISTIGAALAWFGALCYSFQIYYDFSGYSDMAIGLGRMFGFDFLENFNYPYRSLSIREFWRRWHISLSSWFRDYVYIPLGGSKCSTAKTCINLFIVFLLTGIWHGANWTFIVWGVAYGILIVAGRILDDLGVGNIIKKIPAIIKRFTVFVVVTILWIVFRADNMSLASTYIGQLFAKSACSENILTYFSFQVLVALVLAILCQGYIPEKIIKTREYKNVFGGVLVPLVILIISYILLVNNTYNPFIYFQF